MKVDLTAVLFLIVDGGSLAGCVWPGHPRIFKIPSSLDDVFGFCQSLLEQPNATVIVPGDRHWEIFESLCQQSQAKGNIAQDAWFAALAIEFGCEWITTDRDYARFEGLSWRPPF